uniref:Uncharacterized protein n=1 Tax=Bartonella rochalimae ATCC BAA-1498 TaxID=685782 RepID=E6YNE8_9HYPH|nr:hypothetical protein BARRO_130030 [Bartonella rochalimae ATCC BAA-1498]
MINGYSLCGINHIAHRILSEYIYIVYWTVDNKPLLGMP